MAKIYRLRSEIQRIKSKHPGFELIIDAVQDDSYPDRNLPERTVKIPSAQLLPDEVTSIAQTAPVDAAKLLLGDAYDQFLAGGGSASILFQIIQENAGADSLGESSPSTDS